MNVEFGDNLTGLLMLVSRITSWTYPILRIFFTITDIKHHKNVSLPLDYYLNPFRNIYVELFTCLDN